MKCLLWLWQGACLAAMIALVTLIVFFWPLIPFLIAYALDPWGIR